MNCIFNERGDLDVVMSDSVECPLCQIDISDLSEELRQVHTNECLDKDDASKLITQSDDIKPDLPQKKEIDVFPVLEWFSNLGLSRYKEAFIREEIDWDTVKWLTEELREATYAKGRPFHPQLEPLHGWQLYLEH